jgi:organic radical activating enzyme
MIEEIEHKKTPTYDDGIAENPIFSKMKEDLNSVGCGFCLAKWTQVTMHLQIGHTHSCHHPGTHKIPLSELSRNPTALHNTRYKKSLRREMLEGKRPKECGYCWNVEDNSDRFSDRVFKSSESWSSPHLDAIKTLDWRQDYNPKYVEVSFSNACNFKCSYCAPQFSSRWMEEIDEFGAYPTSDRFNDKLHMLNEGKMPIPLRDHNPYVEAFWTWWPELYRDLHTFRITGGEPLMHKDTWDVFDYILAQENPNKNLKLAINSNLGVPDKLIDKFIEKIKQIEEEDRVHEFIIFTSCDSWGEQAEYIRHGLEFNKFWDNINKILTQCKRVNLTFMTTYNALSVPNFDKLIHGVYDLKREYASPDRYWNSAVFLDSSYLRFPHHQTVQVLPMEFANNVYRNTQLVEYYATPSFDRRLIGYSDIEVQKIKRIYDWMLSDKDPQVVEKQRKDFYKFFSEHDRRRGTDFKKVYPELADFYENCKALC